VKEVPHVHPSSFRALYDLHARRVYNLCLNHLRNAEEATEATQDVFVKVHEKLPGFKGDSSLRTWIHRIAINTCLDRIKAAKRKKRSIFGISFSSEERTVEVAVFDHPGVRMEEKERAQQVFRAIDQLPENQRTAILLKATEGMSQQEVAEVMGLSAKAVESLLFRARLNLRALLDAPKDTAGNVVKPNARHGEQ